MTPQTTPLKLDLKRDERLEVRWQDGHTCVYPIAYLRAHCPCAGCKAEREERLKQAPAKSRLTVLKGDHARPLTAVEAELVGNYALRIEWSDNHGSGIYSFQYLREICPENH